jgi:hypothetical protein
MKLFNPIEIVQKPGTDRIDIAGTAAKTVSIAAARGGSLTGGCS